MKGKRGSVDPEKAMAAQFNPNTRVPLKQHCIWIMKTSGIEACAEFLVCRLELGLFDDEKRHRDSVSELVLKAMISTLQFDLERDIADFRQRLLDSVKPHKTPVAPKGKLISSESWERQKALIIEADNKRRASNPAFRQHLEHTRQRPSAKRGRTLQERMAAGWQRNRHLMEVQA